MTRFLVHYTDPSTEKQVNTVVATTNIREVTDMVRDLYTRGRAHSVSVHDTTEGRRVNVTAKVVPFETLPKNAKKAKR